MRRFSEGDLQGGRGVQIQVHAASGSASDPAATLQPNLMPVLFTVAVACAGSLAFGFHLGVVNGPLEAISKDVGIAGNAALEGLVGVPCIMCTRCPTSCARGAGMHFSHLVDACMQQQCSIGNAVAHSCKCDGGLASTGTVGP